MTPPRTPSLETASGPRACVTSQGKQPKTLSSQQRPIPSVRGKRRGPQSILIKIKNPEADVLQLLNNRGIKVEVGRIHIQGGGQP